MSDFPFLNRAAERAAVYALLSRLWDDAPDADLVQQVSEMSAESLPTVWTALITAAQSESIESLEVEYTRLFVGPKDHLPPFQSVWQEHQLDGQATVSMRTFGEVIGLENPSDHIATQLAAMDRILSEATGDNVQPADFASLSMSFFAAHLTWPVDLFGAVERRSTSPFYKALAVLSRDFLTAESDL